jgi:hypothetical protein
MTWILDNAVWILLGLFILWLLLTFFKQKDDDGADGGVAA